MNYTVILVNGNVELTDVADIHVDTDNTWFSSTIKTKRQLESSTQTPSTESSAKTTTHQF